MRMDFRHIANFISCSSPDSVEDLSASSPISEDDVVFVKTERPSCCGCRAVIHDRWMLHVGNQPYHLSCLRCSVCLFTLDKESSCFIRDGSVYCKFHYTREFGTKCAACDESLEASDWVRYARDSVFHLNCFTCSVCGVTLSTGEEFLMRNSNLFCSVHGRLERQHGRKRKKPEPVADESDSSVKPRKRARSNFTKDQIDVLRANFKANPNPTSADLESLSELTGHSYKVIQIWFQNSRARYRKSINSKANEAHENCSASSPWSYTSDSPQSRDSGSPDSQF